MTDLSFRPRDGKTGKFTKAGMRPAAPVRVPIAKDTRRRESDWTNWYPPDERRGAIRRAEIDVIAAAEGRAHELRDLILGPASRGFCDAVVRLQQARRAL